MDLFYCSYRQCFGKVFSIKEKCIELLSRLPKLHQTLEVGQLRFLCCENSPRQSQSSSKKYQKLLFIDKDETQVQAIIYNPDMSLMEDITTAIRHASDDCLPRELATPRFTKFEDIPLFLNTNTLIDVLAIVIDKLEQRTTNDGMPTLQEFVIVNHKKKPMMLTLWNEILFNDGISIIHTADRMPIIEATRLTVFNFRGVSLSARGFANIVVNPTYPETQSLRAWKPRNHLLLAELVEEKKYLQHEVPHPQIPMWMTNFG